jgi:phosphate:Na+ symporter
MLWLDQERAQIEEDAKSTNRRVDVLIRTGEINPAEATSFLNDSSYAYGAMRHLIEAARNYYIERESSMAEVERLLAFYDDEFNEESLTSADEYVSEARRKNVIAES